MATSEQQDTIFVSGLNDFTDEKELDKTFGRFGPIENIRLIASKKFHFSFFLSIKPIRDINIFL